MVFKRRERRPVWRLMAEFLWPRGGWARAWEYVKHRIRRLPDTPEKIGRGIWAGVFAAWTPFFGLHFFMALGLAKLMRGNLLASLLGTFFGNPLTYVPIAVLSMQIGYFLLGERAAPEGIEQSIGAKFAGAGEDIWHNVVALFTPDRMHWDQLARFFDEVLWPYTVGGILPGVLSATVCYYLVVPIIAAYQKRRQRILRKKLDKLGGPGA